MTIVNEVHRGRKQCMGNGEDDYGGYRNGRFRRDTAGGNLSDGAMASGGKHRNGP